MVQTPDADVGVVPAGRGKEKIPVPAWVGNLAGNSLVATVLIGLGSALLVAVRLISVAKFNIETSYGILQASGTTAIIVGTVISLIPGIAVTVASGSVLVLLYCRLSTRVVFSLWLLTVIFVIVAALTTPLLYLAAIPVGAAILGLVGKFRSSVARVARHKRFGAALAVLAAVLLTLGVIQSPPWGPEEHFSFNTGQQVTGYLLAQTDKVTTILLAKPRAIAYYDTGSLTSQYACKSVPWYGFSAIYYLPGFDPVRYPSCTPKTTQKR